METKALKTLRDFPQFVVTALRRGPTVEEGYTHFEIEGSFDHIVELDGPRWFWLILGERGYECATIQSIDGTSRKAILTVEAKETPDIIGRTIACLSARWQGYHVGMVLDPRWGWNRKQFSGLDALAEEFEAKEVSIINGKEVKVWTKLSPLKGQHGEERLVPEVNKLSAPTVKTRIIPLGWDHEHCELCDSHVDIGMFGYCDHGGRWLCENCHARYVVRRDLAFIDER